MKLDQGKGKVKTPNEILSALFIFFGIKLPQKTKFKWFYVIMRTFHICGLAALLLSSISFFLFANFPYIEKMQALQYFIGVMHLYSKYLNLTFNPKLDDLMAEGDVIWAELVAQDEQFKGNFLVFSRKAMAVFKLFAVTAFVSVAVSVSGAAVATFYYNSPVAPFQLWVPFDVSVDPYSVFVLQTILMFEAATSFVVVSVFLFSMTEQIASLLQTVVILLKDNKIERKKIFIIHNRIIKLLGALNSFHGRDICFEMVLSSLHCCTGIFCTEKGYERQDPRLISYTFYVFAAVILPFLICFCGNNILVQSEMLHNTIYRVRWYEDSIKDRRDLYMMLTVASKPLTLNYRNIFTFAFEQFTKVLQGTFSYLTALQTFDI